MSIDVKEIKTLMGGLEKATTPATIIDILGQLKSGVRPTEKLLRVCALKVVDISQRLISNSRKQNWELP